ncbi:relaxase/mobilization nuclease domain-containing protein [Parabacteroides hominis]|uniref:Relaxase/mobilization nuclease domain-containing protein n=1 Tax=Parabacteroides hominis TaxID=2763057 RepID=A0ABR7DRZ8_9BACT|nr:relaxase/mobilization nuclease domain-containing protein [Parabacteroides hominis]MBC5634231.1 relaxase/mobilization nuclease domain-containing protein [Parabacteroides hominis]
MISKMTKGTSFSGCVCYVLREDKARLLEAVGVEGSPNQMAEQFELQSLLNDKVKNIVGHTSLNFSPKDADRLRNDDALMLKIAREYMEKMGIRNTQYIVARHTDRKHPHCHIVFNRADNDGKTISDKNDRYRSEKVCKMLTAKYRLHFANGKENINEERLRPYDRAKHEIYKVLKEELPKAYDWNELKEALEGHDIGMKFKVNRKTREVQGVKFEYGGFTFPGSKVGREFSYLNIERQFEDNSIDYSYCEQPKPQHEEKQIEPQSDESNFGGLGLFMPSSGTAYDTAEQAFENELKRKKKAKRKRGFHL